jgi:hypothetical protein
MAKWQRANLSERSAFSIFLDLPKTQMDPP